MGRSRWNYRPAVRSPHARCVELHQVEFIAATRVVWVICPGSGSRFAFCCQPGSSSAWETASAKPYLDELYRTSPEIAQLAHLGKEFFRIVRCRDLAAWPNWLKDAQHTALNRFVSGITRDRDAVEAALHLPWSNGPVEGQVHRLKLIKRQMYGRASFDLLRLRVLHKA